MSIEVSANFWVSVKDILEKYLLPEQRLCNKSRQLILSSFIVEFYKIIKSDANVDVAVTGIPEIFSRLFNYICISLVASPLIYLF